MRRTNSILDDCLGLVGIGIVVGTTPSLVIAFLWWWLA